MRRLYPENGGCNIGKYIENTLPETNSSHPKKCWPIDLSMSTLEPAEKAALAAGAREVWVLYLLVGCELQGKHRKAWEFLNHQPGAIGDFLRTVDC